MAAISQALLPNGRQQFLDANGNPLAGGSVGMYVPGSMTPSDTYQDPLGVSANANPVPLDASGSALIYGSGQFRQIVQDANGVTIWDALTYGIIPASGGGGSSSGFGAQTGIASAATVDLGSITTFNALITGTTNITSFGSNALTTSPIYYIEFDNTLTLTYNASSMILPGGASIITTHGDGMLIEYLGSGQWRVIAYFPAKGSIPGTQNSIASAGTTNIGSTGSNNVKITGTTTITSLGSGATLSNPVYWVEFSGALTLTNGGSLTLPGSSNIKTTAGDMGIFEYLGGGSWKCRSYMYANGQDVTIFGTEVSLASAATCDLGSTNSNLVLVTGTTGITSLGSSAFAIDAIYRVRFSGALTITNNAASLILPNNVNITTANNDSAVFQYLGSGNWKCLSYNYYAASSALAALGGVATSAAGSVAGAIYFTTAAGAITAQSNSGLITSIARTSQGNYTVTLNGGGGAYFFMCNNDATTFTSFGGAAKFAAGGTQNVSFSVPGTGARDPAAALILMVVCP